MKSIPDIALDLAEHGMAITIPALKAMGAHSAASDYWVAWLNSPRGKVTRDALEVVRQKALSTQSVSATEHRAEGETPNRSLDARTSHAVKEPEAKTQGHSEQGRQRKAVGGYRLPDHEPTKARFNRAADHGTGPGQQATAAAPR